MEPEKDRHSSYEGCGNFILMALFLGFVLPIIGFAFFSHWMGWTESWWLSLLAGIGFDVVAWVVFNIIYKWRA